MPDSFLSVNMAMTLDGKVMRPDGKWYGLSSREDKINMDRLRAKSEILIAGKNSIIQDDPDLSIRYVEGKSPRPLILLRSGEIPTNRKVFQNKNNIPLIFCLKKNKTDLEKSLLHIAEIHILSGETLEPEEVIEKLSFLGYNKILLEGGPKLNHPFFEKDLVNEINLTLVPYIIGQNNLPAIVDGEKFIPDFSNKKWELKSCNKYGEEVFLVYHNKFRKNEI